MKACLLFKVSTFNLTKRMVRGVRGGGQLFDGGHCLNIFVKGGQYYCSSKVIYHGTAIIYCSSKVIYHGTAIILGIWVHCINGSCLGDKAANMTKQEKKLISQHNKHSKFQPQQHLANEPQAFFINSLVALFGPSVQQ